jgi:hypothetical protein
MNAFGDPVGVVGRQAPGVTGESVEPVLPVT